MSLQKLLEIKNRLPKKYQERLLLEMEVISNNGIRDFAPYFMLLKEMVDWVHSQGFITGPARGSAGGSLVAYLLGIHALDPIQYRLPFKRFFSKSRLKKSVPDIDTDFPTAIRDKLNDYLFDKYGDRAAFVATFSMMKLKNSLQDSWRINVTQPMEMEIAKLKADRKTQEMSQMQYALEKKTEEFGQIRKSLGTCPIGFTDNEWLDGCEKDGIRHAGLLETNDNFKKWTDKYPKVLETVREVMGIPRGAIGKHAAGVVISDVPIYELAPVLKNDGKNVIAYDKKTIAKLGLIKNDNLGLTTLDFIQNCLNLIKARGVVLDPWNLPEDPDVYNTFLDGHCRTIFQHDTVGGASFVKKLHPTCFDHIALSVSLNRPGALDAMVKIGDDQEVSGAEAFVMRKAGTIEVEYIHQDLKPILEETLGIPVFQEQVMEMLQKLANYTEEESDAIRSAISDKNPNALSEVKERLYKFLPERGWKTHQIDEIYQTIMAWGAYGFNRSHAYGYAKLAYATAYFKYHFPLEWWVSVLANSTADDIMEKFWPEVGPMVSESNINLSKGNFIIANGKIMPPLSLISNVGDKALDDIVSKAPFTDLPDFVTRITSSVVNKRVVFNLLKSGAMNSLFKNGETLPDQVNEYLFLKANKEGKKKIEELPEELQNLTPYKSYILAKNVLPICVRSLSDAIEKTHNITKPFLTMSDVTTNGRIVDYQALRGKTRLIKGATLKKLIDNIDYLDDNFIEVCAYGYVVAARRFTYVSKKYNAEKEALEVTLDFDNQLHKILCWPKAGDFSPGVSKYIKESTCFLFKIRVNKEENFGRLNISGMDAIKEKKLDKEE